MRFKYLAALVLWASGTMCMPQTADVLGPHHNSGHGCNACHVRHGHSEPWSRGGSAVIHTESLWGDEPQLAPAGTEPSASPVTPEPKGLLICLSCHDGNYAPAAMMKSRIYETIPPEYGSFANVPSLSDKPGVSTGMDINQHPVGESARMSCAGDGGWDCVLTAEGLSMEGKHASRFVMNYGFFVKPRRQGNGAVVECTSCHNPHLMNVVNVPKESASALYPAGTYATRYFLRAPYSPDALHGGNQSAQFCRQCHADKSNEMNGSRIGSGL